MYLAPLNYDRYFKKVFSDLKIAKRFLEDFLDIEIQEIEILPLEKAVTDDARYVAFDFRCKIDNNYVIIDMQQWYKPDVVKRFYIYDSLNTALQLEKLSKKAVSLPKNKIKEVKDYSELIPVITIIWFVHDTLNFTEDFVSYTLTPENVSNFIRDIKLWNNPSIEKIILQREKVLKTLNNNTKNLLWLQENKLIYAFQKNISKSKNFTKYKNWFEFAEKTLQKVSDRFAYDKYEDDIVFKEMIRRLKKEVEKDDEIKYITECDEYFEEILRYDTSLHREALQEGKYEGRIETELKLLPLIEAEKKKAEAEHLKLLKTVKFLKSLGVENHVISEQTGISISEIE